MRVSQQEKDRSHERIVESAARLIRERGVAGVSVADTMKDAGMTAGGFYRHFANKEAMATAAVESAFEDVLGRLGSPDEQTSEAVAEYERFYLSALHVENRGYGCPIAALAGESGRTPALEEPMTIGVERTIAGLAAGQGGSAVDPRADAAATVAMMAGAVMIARAVDPELGRFILESVRDRLGLNDSAPRRTGIDQGEQA